MCIRDRDCTLFSDVCTRNESKPAYEPGAKIGNDISIKVLQQHNVELLWPHDELHTGVIDDLVFCFNLRIAFAHLAKAIEKESVRQLHNVRFMNCSDLFSRFLNGIFEGELGDTRGGFLSNDF